MFTETNDVAIEAWNTVLYEKFLRFKHLLTRGLGVHGDATLARLAPGPRDRVLDLGCGFGDTTRDLARIAREAVGVDAAVNFVEAARREAAEEGLANARFFAADVQLDDLDGEYDHAFSRFGTMFFVSPGAALANVRRHVRPGGRLAMVVWRKREDNEFMYAAEQVAKRLIPEDPSEEGAVTCGPGPFSMASADLVSTILRGCGWDQVAFERHDAPVCIGADLDEAVAFAMALGPAGERLRLAGDEAERLRPQLIDALREALSAYDTGNGVLGPSSTWIVTARAV